MNHDLLVSFDISPLFTNVPVDETIESIAEKAFENNWFNEEHSLNITKSDLIELLPAYTSSFNLKEICTNRWMVLLWVRLWDL